MIRHNYNQHNNKIRNKKPLRIKKTTGVKGKELIHVCGWTRDSGTGSRQEKDI